MSANLALEDDEKGVPLNPNMFFKELSYETPSIPDVKFTRKLKKNKLSFENNKPSKVEGKLSVCQKLCFAVGGLPYQLTSNCIGLFVPTFLLEIAGLRPKYLSIILFMGKFWDAVTDPLVGCIVFKTNTRFGKMRPWILFSAPFAVFCYMMFWYVPDIDREHKLYWYLIFYCLFQTFSTCLHVPYTSLTMYLTHNQKERDSATGYRMGLEVTGVFLAAVIQGLMITVYGAKFSCEGLPNNASNATNETFSHSKHNISIPDMFSEAQEDSGYPKLAEGYLVSAGIMGSIYLICCWITFFGTEEIKDVITEKKSRFIGSIGRVFKSTSYLTLLLAFLFNSLAAQLLQTNIALYCKYSIAAKDEYQLIIMILLATTILSVPLWQTLMQRYGKKLTYGIGLLMFIPNLFPLLFLSDQIALMYVLAAICGISMSSHFLLPWSMLPDVIDEFMIKTGQRQEAIFYSFFVFFTKFSAGISVAVSSLFLEFAGYEDCPNGCCEQPHSVKLTLRLLLVPVPVILCLLSILCLYFHPINEKQRRENKETLENIRKKSRDTLNSMALERVNQAAFSSY